MIILYRHLRGKYQARQAKLSNQPPAPASGPEVSQTSSNTQDDVQHNRAASSSNRSWQGNVLLMIALAIPVFLETLDYTVVATAQVHIASDFNRLDLQSYIGTIYLLTSTVFLPPFASIADIFGRHWAMQLSLFLFLAGSAISTAAQDMPMMLAGRGVAGIGAAGLLAVVRIILTDSGSLNNVNWQQAIMFTLYTIGYCLGPFIGGELISVSFRWIFAINLPCCAVAMALGFFLLRGRTKGPQPSQHMSSITPASKSRWQNFLDKLFRIDWVGSCFFLAGGVLLLLALNWGSTEKWDSAKVIACFIAGGLLLIVFLVWEYLLEKEEEALQPSKLRLFTVDPMIPLVVFRNLNICIVQFGTFVNGMVMLVMFYFVAIFFVVVSGLSASKSGAQLIYFAPGMGGGSLIAIQVIKRTRQPKLAIVCGAVVSVVALGLVSYGMDKNKQSLVNGFMVMAGVGTGLQIAPLAVQARFSLPASRNAVVSGLTLFFRSFGGTIGLAQCGAVLNSKVNSYIVAQVRNGAISGADAQAIAAASTSSGLTSLESINALPGPIQAIVRDAFRQGSRFAFISLIPWCALAFIASLFLGKITEEQREEQERGAREGERMLQGENEKVSVDSSPIPKPDVPAGVLSEHEVSYTPSKV